MQQLNYISLVCDTPISTKYKKIWYQIVEKCVPSGMIGSQSIIGPDQQAKPVSHVHLARPKYHEYMVFLTGPLEKHTIDCIVYIWDRLFPNDDFLIKASHIQVQNALKKQSATDFSQPDMALMLSKLAHNRWVAKMIGQGWRWGMQKDVKNKIHPLLKDWDLLPEQWRKAKKHLADKIVQAYQL